MADLILPAVQLGHDAWRNVSKALRQYDDEHLTACAEEIDRQVNLLESHFGDEPGKAEFSVKITLKAA